MFVLIPALTNIYPVRIAAEIPAESPSYARYTLLQYLFNCRACCSVKAVPDIATQFFIPD